MDLQHFEQLKRDLTRFMMMYKFALEELNTRIDILKQEFQYIHEYNPIEHITYRVKSPESIMQKVIRKQVPFTLESIRENIRDIAGMRIICSFVSDVYNIKEMLEKQSDLEIVECKDYIQHPKPNGYRSLHLIVKVPVFMSDYREKVWAEIQIRTITMDFWASIEHKLNYKYNYDIPQPLLDELKQAALAVAELDAKMEKINRDINNYKATRLAQADMEELYLISERFRLPLEFLRRLLDSQDN